MNDVSQWSCLGCDAKGDVPAEYEIAIEIARFVIADHAERSPQCCASPSALNVRLAANLIFNCAVPADA
jgi:hypothetical protein